MCCPVYLLVIRGGEQTSRETTRGSAHAVYVPAEFHLPLMKLFVFMTSCHPGELNETWHQFSIPRVSASLPPPGVNNRSIMFVGVRRVLAIGTCVRRPRPSRGDDGVFP